MKRLAFYFADVLKFSIQLSFEFAIGAIVFTLTLALAAALLCFILSNVLK